MSIHQICELCAIPISKDVPDVSVNCTTKMNDDVHQFTLCLCPMCYASIARNEKDDFDRYIFPSGKPIILYKVKRYSFPSKKKKKKLEDWKLFSPLKTRGKKVDYS